MSLLHKFSYVRAESLAHALDTLATHGDEIQVVAGGTVIVALIRHRMIEPKVLVGLEGIPGVADIRVSGAGLTIGALATHRAVSRSEDVRRVAPLLARACAKVASPAIRSMGTLGGNVCFGEPASDPGPALLAQGARLRIHGPRGERTVDITDHYLGYYETSLGMGEVLESVEVDPTAPGSRSTYLKWTPRAREDKPLVGLAVVLEMDRDVCTRARLAVGGVADRPTLLSAASALLVGRRLSEDVIADASEAAADEVEPIEDVQASAGFRRDMLRLWTSRTLQQLAAGEEK
ncbi:MAG: FAD binding domain-containing protein [Acidimicrobiales bacterium]